MPSESYFGNIFIGTQLEEAALATLRSWMPTYIQEIERQLGRTRDKIPAPALYTTRNEFTSFPEDKMPMCVAVSTGLAEQPTAEGDGVYSAWFVLGVGFAATGRDAEIAGFLAKLYGGAGRAILLHKQSLGGVAQGVEWVDESYDDLVDEDSLQVKACYNIYRVRIWDVVTRFGGPPTPIPPDPVNQPGSTWPEAETVDVQITLKDLDEEVS